MGNTDILREFSRLAVRIAGDAIPNLHGSGVLFLRNPEEPAIVLTAAHVIDSLFQTETGAVTNTTIVLTFSDATDTPQTVIHNFQFADRPSAEIYTAYIHSDYKRGHDSRKFDVGILICPWSSWMHAMKRISLADDPTEQHKQVGWGFPEALNGENPDNTVSLSGKHSFCGTATAPEPGRYKLNYAPMGRPEGDVPLTSMMKGFSGSGAYEQRDNGIYLTGVVSGRAGSDAAGTLMWMSSASLFREIFEQCGLQTGLPKSLKPYAAMANNQIDRDFQKEARTFLEDCLGELIEENGLSAESFTDDGEIPFDSLPCDCGSRKHCNQYWQGQLEKAACFCSLFGVPPATLAHPQIPVMEQPEISVLAEFLCSNAECGRILRLLLEENYFSRYGKGHDNTIFLLNHPDGMGYDSFYSRAQCRRIVVDIAEDAPYDDYSGRKKFCEQTAQLSDGKTKEPYNFDIVKGEVGKCNLAFVGMGRLFQVMKEGAGDIASMTHDANDLFKKAWREN